MATPTHVERTVEPPCWPTRESVHENLRQARRAVQVARHAAEDAVSEAALSIRRHPLQAVGGAILVGAVAGAVFGFGAGWFAHNRR